LENLKNKQVPGLCRKLILLLMNRITFLLTLNLCCSAIQPLFSQSCYEISRSKDKETGRETYYGEVGSRHWYVSAGRQFYRKDSIPPNFYLLVYNVWKKKVKINKLFNFGKMRIHLEDNSILHLDSVRYDNDPLRQGGGFSAKVYLVDEEVQKLNAHPILRIYLEDHDIPLDGFTRKKFFKIVNCLVKQE